VGCARAGPSATSSCPWAVVSLFYRTAHQRVRTQEVCELLRCGCAVEQRPTCKVHATEGNGRASAHVHTSFHWLTSQQNRACTSQAHNILRTLYCTPLVWSHTHTHCLAAAPLFPSESLGLRCHGFTQSHLDIERLLIKSRNEESQ